jgi:hypothetical protein
MLNREIQNKEIQSGKYKLRNTKPGDIRRELQIEKYEIRKYKPLMLNRETQNYESFEKDSFFINPSYSHFFDSFIHS